MHLSMKKHRDLLSILRAKSLRLTPARRMLLQYIIDNKNKQLPLQDIQKYLEKNVAGVNRSSIYRNLELFKKLEIVQELNIPKKGKSYQYIFDDDVHHFYICKTCGKANRDKEQLFTNIQKALNKVKGFSDANLSVVFYGHCPSCRPRK